MNGAPGVSTERWMTLAGSLRRGSGVVATWSRNSRRIPKRILLTEARRLAENRLHVSLRYARTLRRRLSAAKDTAFDGNDPPKLIFVLSFAVAGLCVECKVRFKRAELKAYWQIYDRLDGMFDASTGWSFANLDNCHSFRLGQNDICYTIHHNQGLARRRKSCWRMFFFLEAGATTYLYSSMTRRHDEDPSQAESSLAERKMCKKL